MSNALYRGNEFISGAIDVNVPNKTSQLTNDSKFIQNENTKDNSNVVLNNVESIGGRKMSNDVSITKCDNTIFLMRPTYQMKLKIH